MHYALRMVARVVAAVICAAFVGCRPPAAVDCDALATPSGRYRCWMDAGIHEMDACVGMMDIADPASAPSIEAVLRRNEPVHDANGRWSLIDTSGACLSALITATATSA